MLEAAGLQVAARSPVYRTEPVEVVDQEWFANQVVAVETVLEVPEVLSICLGIERAMGRVRGTPKGPRNIDLDLLLAGEEVYTAGGIEVPHPRMHLRRFVLVPLNAIDPGVRHPVLGRTVGDLLAACPDRSRVEPFHV